jgi:hypothetical protein
MNTRRELRNHRRGNCESADGIVFRNAPSESYSTVLGHGLIRTEELRRSLSKYQKTRKACGERIRKVLTILSSRFGEMPGKLVRKTRSRRYANSELVKLSHDQKVRPPSRAASASALMRPWYLRPFRSKTTAVIFRSFAFLAIS